MPINFYWGEQHFEFEIEDAEKIVSQLQVAIKDEKVELGYLPIHFYSRYADAYMTIGSVKNGDSELEIEIGDGIQTNAADSNICSFLKSEVEKIIEALQKRLDIMNKVKEENE